MYDIIKKLLFARELDLEKGHIKLLGHTIIMAPVSSFIELRKILAKMDSTAVLYKACKKSGIDYMNTLVKKFTMKKSRELIEWGMNTISLAGWGNVEIVKYDEKKKYSIIRLYDSEFAKNYGRSNEPVDDVFRGFFAATGTVVFKTKMDAIETKCLNLGNNVCEFTLQESKKFDKKDDFIFKQLFVKDKKIEKMIESL